MYAERSIRVDLMSPAFWPEVRRGSERFVRDLADGLLGGGHRPRVITSHPGRPTRSVEDGLPVHRVWRPPNEWLERRGLEWYLTHWPSSEVVLRRGDADVAHSVFATDALAAARWSHASGRPAVFSYMGIPDQVGLHCRRLRALITRRAVAGSRVTVALSQSAAEAFSRELGIEARVINPGVDLRAFTPGGERFPEPTIFCGAAVGDPMKRVGLLLAAFSHVRREHGDARLLLSRPRDPREAAALDRDGVELVDVDDREALADTYRRSWVSALPSNGEAFGLVLIEALACGTPVVAANRGGMREVVAGASVGRLFDGDDERALAEALLEVFELVRDPRTSLACRARAEEFSVERTTDSYVSLYREVMAA